MKVYLRELTHNDVTEEYLNSFKDDDVLRFLEVDGKSLTKKIVEDYMDYGRETGTYYMYAICYEENNKHIGNLKIGPIDHKNNVSDLVTVIWNKNYWGKGLATEAIKLGISLAFEKYNIRKLHAQIHIENIGSIKAYCKAGWIIEAIIKGRYLINGQPMDRVLVSCNNPKYFNPAGQDMYNVEKLKEWIKFRETILNP